MSIPLAKEQAVPVSGIAWDDQYAGFEDEAGDLDLLGEVAHQLDRFGVRVELTDDADQFVQWLHEKRPNFVLLDVWEENAIDGGGRPVGLDLLQAVRKSALKIPVILVTGLYGPIRSQNFFLQRNEYLLSKNQSISRISDEILDILEQWAVRLERGRVTLWGRGAEQLGETLAQNLPNIRLNLHQLEPQRLATLDLVELREQINHSTAFVGLFSPHEQDAFFTGLGFILALPDSVGRIMLLQNINESDKGIPNDFGIASAPYAKLDKGDAGVKSVLDFVERRQRPK